MNVCAVSLCDVMYTCVLSHYVLCDVCAVSLCDEHTLTPPQPFLGKDQVIQHKAWLGP